MLAQTRRTLLKFDPSFLKTSSTPMHEAAQRGDLAAVRRLLVEPNSDVFRLDGREMDPVTWAARGGHDEMLDLLLDHREMIHKADAAEKAPEEAMTGGEASRGTVAVSGSHPLLAAASRNQLSTVKKLLGRGGSLDVVDETMGHSAIHMAANRGHFEVVRTLLEANMSPNGADNRGYTPLAVACFTGRLEVVRLLLEAKAEAEIRIEDPPHGPYTPLSLACRKQRVEVIKALLEHGAEPDKRCVSYAEDHGDEELVAALTAKIGRGA